MLNLKGGISSETDTRGSKMRDDELTEGLLMPLFWHPWYPIFVFFGVFAFLLIPALGRGMRKSSWEGLSLVAYALGLLSVVGIIETGRNNLVKYIVAGGKERIGEIYRWELSMLQHAVDYYDHDDNLRRAVSSHPGDPIVDQIRLASTFFHDAVVAFGEGYEARKWRKFIGAASPETAFPPLKPDDIPLHRNVYSSVKTDHEKLSGNINSILLYEDRIAKATALNSDKQDWDIFSWLLAAYFAAITSAIQAAKASAGIRGFPPDPPAT